MIISFFYTRERIWLLLIRIEYFLGGEKMGNNLLGKTNPYLHSSPETFYNNLLRENIVGGDDQDQKTIGRFTAAIQSFETRASSARSREKEFYSYFKDSNGNVITSAEQWSKAFLISEADNATLSQKVLKVFNSLEMRNAILSLSKVDEEELRTRALTLADNAGLDEKTKKDIVKKIEKASYSSLERIIGDIFEQVVLQQRQRGSKNVDAIILKELAKKVQGAMPEIITAAGKSRNIGEKNKGRGKSIKQAVKSISRQGTPSQQAIIEKIIVVFRTLLKDKITEEEMIFVEQKFKEYLREKVINLSSFTAGDTSNITGGVQEVGSVLSINLIDKSSLNTSKVPTISAKSMGQEFVSRANLKNQVESKTDTMISFARKGCNNRFRIQEKNSLNAIYNELEVVDRLDKEIEQNFARMKVQGETSLSNYYSTASLAAGKGASFLGDEEQALLSYVLVNFLSLSSSNYTPPKGKSMSGFHKGFSSPVRALIEQLLSLNATVYFSDIVTSANEVKSIDTVDFIIYKSRFLIPMSYVYTDIVSFLQQTKNYAIGAANSGKSTQFYTSFNFSGVNMQQMNKEKEEARNQAGDNNKDYSNTNLVNVGRAYGSEAFDNISIRSVQLDIDPRRFRNIVSQTFSG